MLELNDLSVRYGDALAVTNVALDVGEREIVAVIGANGAGKSSLGKAMAGLVPSTGRLVLDGRDLSSARAEARVLAGIVYVPEGRRVFTQLPVHDNLRAGAFTCRRSSPWQERLAEIYERLPRLKERQHIKAALLSGGEQQLLAICRALMAFPKVLILDEPSLGLSPTFIGDVVSFLQDLRVKNELSIVILEQNIAFTARLAERAWVMNLGRFLSTLTVEEVRDPERARAALLHAEGLDPPPGEDPPEVDVASVRVAHSADGRGKDQS